MSTKEGFEVRYSKLISCSFEIRDRKTSVWGSSERAVHKNVVARDRKAQVAPYWVKARKDEEVKTNRHVRESLTVAEAYWKCLNAYGLLTILIETR